MLYSSSTSRAYRKSMERLVCGISSDPSHALYGEHDILPSNRHFTVLKSRLNRFRNSFIPQLIVIINQKSELFR